jgi:hypothetical protein
MKKHILFLIVFICGGSFNPLLFAQNTIIETDLLYKQKIQLHESYQFCDYKYLPFIQPGKYSNVRDEAPLLKAIIEDFQVNEHTGIGGAFQSFPSIAEDSDGNYVIAWGDQRNGWDCDIYAQRYSSEGVALGNNFRVNDQLGSVALLWSGPSLAVDKNGNFTITWTDSRRGGNNVYAQRYDSDGVASGNNFQVTDNEGSVAEFSGPCISVDGSGNFIIVWGDERNGNPDIYAQRYSNDGTVVGSNFKVNDDQGTTRQRGPTIAADNSGNFIITWHDERDSDADDIYAQRYSSNGTAQGGNFKVNDDTNDASQLGPAISADNLGNFIITWDDSRHNNCDIYAQRYSADGSTIGVNFKINDNTGSDWQFSPSVSANGSGNFVITWMDERNSTHPNIYAQRFSSSGNALGSNFQVNDDVGTAWPQTPDVIMNGSGNFVITWSDDRTGSTDHDIYHQRYSNNGSALGSNFMSNDDQGDPMQCYPNIAVDGSGNFIVEWWDTRDGGDIYAQRFSNLGTALGGNFQVNSDEAYVGHLVSSISVDATGNFIITWSDGRDDNYNIYAQQYTSEGSSRGSNVKVNDDAGDAWQVSPSVTSDNNGNYIISWQDYRNECSDHYAQRFSNEGVPLGNNFKINDESGSVFT